MSIIQEEKNTFYIATGIYFQESKIKMNKKHIENMQCYIYYLHVWLVVSDISSVMVVEHYTNWRAILISKVVEHCTESI